MTIAQKKEMLSRQIQNKIKFKSNFEELIHNTLGGKVEYEPDTLGYVQPEKTRKYTPDFKLRPNHYIEAKGLFTSDDRQKMLWVKEQYPKHTFYLLFQNANSRLSKKSKTTYAMWAEKNGFQWAHMPKGIPEHWIKNEPTPSN
jgi:hypothetical protein